MLPVRNMTSRLVVSVPTAFVLVAAFVAATGTASAHGVCAAREIDTRILTDADAVAYGGPEGVASEGGHDLLAIDVREAYDTVSGEPAIIFRLIVQGGDASKGELKDVLSLKAAGAAKTFEVTTRDGASFSSTFDAFAGPFDVCDGFPKALDGLVKYSTLGVTPGAKLEDITVTGYVGSAKADIAPGSWYYDGQIIPENPMATTAPASHVLKGPAQLVNVTAATTHVDLTQTQGPFVVNITLENALSTMEQFVNLSLGSPDGVDASLDQRSVKLATSGAEKTKTLMLTVSRTAAAAQSTLRLVSLSDLGGRTEQEFMIMVPDEPMTGMNHTMQNGTMTNDYTTIEHGAEHDEAANVPGTGLLGLAAATLVGLFVAARRCRK